MRIIKFFIIAILISIPFWWSVNLFQKDFENFLFWREMSENSQVLAAHISQQNLETKLREVKPIKSNKENLEINATSAFSLFIPASSDYSEKILFKKSKNKKLAIASLTKLMTAYVSLKNYDLNKTVFISKKAVEEEGDSGKLKVGEELTVKDLLYVLLIESSNDAAYSLSEISGKEAFVDLMNLEAKNLGLNNTYFMNPTGLDPDNENELSNLSTVNDISKLTKKLLKNSLILKIFSIPEMDFYTGDGVFHHHIKNTNELIFNPKWETKIIGGKTGWTPKAMGCLLLITKAPRGSGILINVILGADDRFKEMEKLVDWVQESYIW